MDNELALVGLYRGIVTTTDDPESKLRVKVKVPQEFGDDETDWALPANPLGLSQVPDPKEPVWVMFESGDPRYPVYFGSWKEAGVPVLLVGDTIDGGNVDFAPGSIPGADIEDFTISITKYSDSRHHFNPPAVLSNSPTAGKIAWPSFTMVYQNTSYTIAAGNTALAYVWWVLGATSLSASNTLPALTVNDCLIFLNKSGIAVNAQLAQAVDGSLVVSGSILANAIAANTITAAQIAANTLTAAQIAAGSIGTGQLAANSITATQIAAGAINGMTITGNSIIGGTITGGTITGTTYQTAASGGRIKIDATTAFGEVLFYSGDAAELSAGDIAAGTIGTGTDRQPAIVMAPSCYNALDLGNNPVYFEAVGRPVNTASSKQIYAWIYSIGDVVMAARQTSVRQPQYQMSGTGPTSFILIQSDNQDSAASDLYLAHDHFQLESGNPGGSNWVYVNTQTAGAGSLFCNVPYGHMSVVDGVGGYKPILASAFTPSSSQRIKREVVGLESSLDELMKLRPVEYRLKKTPRPTFANPESRWHAGKHRSLVAEEVAEVIPHAMVPHADTGEAVGIDIVTLLATTIGAIQELKTQVDEMRKV